MRTKPDIHQTINLRMIQVIDHYLITKNPILKKRIPKSLLGKSRYNTCYDFPRPTPPLEMINEYITSKGHKVRNYLKNNLSRSSYLRVDIFPSPTGTYNRFSLLKERPSDYADLERTGAVRFVDVKDVRLE